ncbi:unnamed protein product [Oreochromis niloticus]|nr:unnamed protein product [Mustela putorius furo]
MEFSLDDFVEAPALCKIEKCRKADLLLVADYYGVVVSGSAHKAELRDELAGRLVEKGVLQGVTVKGAESAAVEAGAEAASAAAVGAEVDSVSDPGEATASADLRLTLRIKEVETRNKALEVQALHLRIRALELEKSPSPGPPASPNVSVSTPSSFDISKHISLVPPFRESEVDSYFNAFERIAAALKWPKGFWSLLLQCKLVGKAQEVCSSLSIDQSLDYETLKKIVLQAYELVPEAYRQRFRNLCKAADHTFVEFARKVKTLADLQTLILLEEFKKCLPERIVTYLNEQKVSSLTDAALLADEFVLTHKSVFCVEKPFPAVVPGRKQSLGWWRRGNSAAARAAVPRACFYCHGFGHLIIACPALKRKEARGAAASGGVGLIETAPSSGLPSPDVGGSVLGGGVDPQFSPFVSRGFVSLTGEETDRVPVTILRDTGAYHSFLLESVLPLSERSSCGSNILVWGIKMSVTSAPVHTVFLQSPLVTGYVKVAVRPRLPIAGIFFILGNDFAGGRVFPSPEVMPT